MAGDETAHGLCGSFPGTVVATTAWLGWLNDEAEEEAHRFEGHLGSEDRG